MYITAIWFGSGGGGDGGCCHSTFHTTQWIFHELFSQTEYNSVSFWGKLYLIERNVGLECNVEYCAFCRCVCVWCMYYFYTFFHTYGIHTFVYFTLSQWQQFTFFIESSDTFIAYFVCLSFDLFKNRHSLNFTVENSATTTATTTTMAVYGTSKSTHTHAVRHHCICIRNSRLFVWQSMNFECHTCKHHFHGTPYRAAFLGSVLLNPFCSLHWLLIATIIQIHMPEKKREKWFRFVFKFKTTKHNRNIHICVWPARSRYTSLALHYLFISSF